MGGSWISVVSLSVLLFTSYTANMKTTTKSSSTIQDRQEKSTSTVPNISPTKQTTSNFANYVVLKTGSAVKNFLSNFNDTETKKNNVTKIPNCNFFGNETTEVSYSEMNSSSTISKGKQIVTYRDFPEYAQYKILGRFSTYMSNIPGFITNTLTIMIALKIKPRHTSEIYMFVLGFADLITVIIRLTHTLIEQHLENKTGLICKMLGYFLTSGQVYSNLILVSWTIERLIAVIFPMKLASWCSIRITKIIATILLLFCLLVSIPYITDIYAINIWNGRTIVNTCSFSVFMLSVWYHIESVYYIYFPITLVFICNITILCKLSSMTKVRIRMANNQDTIDKKSNENRKMTILLLSISGTFLVLHIPYAIVMVINYLYPDITVLLVEDPHTFAKYLLYTTCGFVITEFQNSVNFFLYCISGTKFRSTFRKLFCRHIAVTKSGT